MSNPNLDALRALAEKAEADPLARGRGIFPPDTVRALVELVEQQHAALSGLLPMFSERTDGFVIVSRARAAYDAFGSATDREAEPQ